ncbi:polysaccharide deacetylase family protein [Gorillibacterium massiliense]|uniref:polysaccharide deacetylase family protein n=1 Tax=Gorillibacterium massiliense TaxID=1280390 RepID=UPI0004AE0158|nr:polysaccharide deacetylase family protein [Gorillibacterium massiliense]
MGKRLIINCDDFGQSSAINKAVIHLLEEKKVSSATIMTVAPGFEEAAEWAVRKRQKNIGLHLTMNSEFDAIRWSSLTGDPSLHDAGGHQFKTVKEFELTAKTGAVLKEMNAQYKRATKAGLILSHLDNHMGSLYGIETGRSLLPQTLWKASRWKLPFRFFHNVHKEDPILGSLTNIDRSVARGAALADALGVPILDYLLQHPFHLQPGETYASFKKSILDKLYRLPEGVSETFFHPGVEDKWMRANIPDWEKREWEFRLLTDADFAYAMKDAKVILTDYHYVRTRLKRPRISGVFRLLRELLR